MQDVATKLGLSSVADTESVVAKTIRDGSIAAVIDHEAQVLMSRTTGDVYITKEPQQVRGRIAFCKYQTCIIYYWLLSVRLRNLPLFRCVISEIQDAPLGVGAGTICRPVNSSTHRPRGLVGTACIAIAAAPVRLLL